MAAPLLIVTVGLPYSGKSTWAQQQGCPIVCPDAVRMAVHGRRFIFLAEPIVWTHVTIMVRALFNAGHDKVVLDGTANTRKRRRQWCGQMWLTKFKVFRTSRDECVARAQANNDVDVVAIIERMSQEHEMLVSDEVEFVV